MATKSQKRLGRGLSSLISVNDFDTDAPPAHHAHPPRSAAEPPAAPTPPPAAISPPVVQSTNEPIAAPTGAPLLLSPDDIRPNPHQPRKTMNDATLGDLASSIKITGLIQPIIVRLTPDGYELIAGERRLRAAKLAGLDAIPVFVREADSATQAQMALIENIQREDLNPIERGEGYRTLMAELGLTQAELAGRLAEDRSSIANYLRLLDLAMPVREMVQDGRLSMGHAKIIAGVPDPADQERLANLAVGQTLSVRNLERLVQQPAKPDQPSPKPAGSAHIQDLERNLTSQLGMRVHIRTAAAKGKGKVILHYTSLDEFDTLLAKLGVRVEE